MKIHEYQAKELMRARGIPVPLGRVATTADEAVAAVRPIVEESGNPVVVVKSQIHAGGRGKGRFVEHPDVGGVTVVTEGVAGGIEATEAQGAGAGREDARLDPRHHPDRARGQAGQPPLRGAGHRHRAGALPVDRARPRPGAEHGDGVDRRGHRDRGGGGRDPGEDRPPVHRPCLRVARVRGGPGGRRPRARPATPTATASPSSRPSPSSPSSSTPTSWRSTRWW